MNLLRRLVNFVAPGALDDERVHPQQVGGAFRLRLEPFNKRLAELRSQLAVENDRIATSEAMRDRCDATRSARERDLIQARAARERVLQQIATVTTERDVAIAELSEEPTEVQTPRSQAQDIPELLELLVRARVLVARRAEEASPCTHLDLCRSQLEFWLNQRRRIQRLVGLRFQPGELMLRRINSALETVDAALVARSNAVLDELELGSARLCQQDIDHLLEENEESFRLVIDLTSELVEHTTSPNEAIEREQKALQGLQGVLDRIRADTAS